MAKWRFGQSKVLLMGRVVSDKGIEVNNENLKALQEWHLPKTVKQLTRFLVAANFYRQFVWIFRACHILLISYARSLVVSNGLRVHLMHSMHSNRKYRKKFFYTSRMNQSHMRCRQLHPKFTELLDIPKAWRGR